MLDAATLPEHEAPLEAAALASQDGDQGVYGTTAQRLPGWRDKYLPVTSKFAIALLVATGWAGLSIWLSQPWLSDLAGTIGWPLAITVITFIAYVPGFMNAFLIGTILLDRRPQRLVPSRYPGVTLLIACYNEEEKIADTLRSISLQSYQGAIEVLVLNDGSTDRTAMVARQTAAALLGRHHARIRVVDYAHNAGKSHVLNRGLALASHRLVVTLDGDSMLHPDALLHIVERKISDPPGTVAVAGAVLVHNTDATWLTRAQRWDYFHGIAAVKRMQSMYHGTLVAQGAFSLYERDALRAVGGYPHCVGEDIVVSWALLERGHRIGYAEDAVVFTNVPTHLKQFARQRKRWSRGLIEAFMRHPRLLLKKRMTTLFVWWNLLFLPLDLAYTFAFIPGLVLAMFGHYHIVGIMTLTLLPLGLIWNGIIYRAQRRVFKRHDIRLEHNVSGFLTYAFAYSLVMQPVCVWGYVAELAGMKKQWGTK